MKHLLALAAIVLTSSVAVAQERINPDEAERFARLFVTHTAKLDNLQVKADVDPARPYGIKKDDIGALVIPDKRLTEKTLQEVGAEVVPIGHLWMRNLSIVVGNQPAPTDRLRVVTVSINDTDHPLPVFMLGAQKRPDGSLGLVIYGKEREPLAVVPVKTNEKRQELPIELEGRGENERGMLTICILGRYQAEVPLARQQP
jgi:hypothetical protein